MDKKSSSDYKFCNHYHEMTEDHSIVDFGDGKFVANKDGIPLLKALNELGIRTRTHHIEKRKHGFISILLDEGMDFNVRIVKEGHAERTKYNGRTELLITWDDNR